MISKISKILKILVLTIFIGCEGMYGASAVASWAMVQSSSSAIWSPLQTANYWEFRMR